VTTLSDPRTSARGAPPNMPVWDGAEIFYRAWIPTDPSDKALLLFHRGHEHSGPFEEVVERLDLHDINIFARDARGHGCSPVKRGHAESFAAMVRDGESLVRGISARHKVPIEHMVVLAHSVRAVTIAGWVHGDAPPILAVVLAAPALRVRLYVPLAIPALRLWGALRGECSIRGGVTGTMLTHDAALAAAYHADPSISRHIAVHILLGLHDASTRLLADASAIQTSMPLLSAGRDWVVTRSAQETFFERLASPIKEMRVYEGMFHSILHDTDRHLPINDARQFIVESFARGSSMPSLRHADWSKAALSQRAFLSSPAPLWQRP